MNEHTLCAYSYSTTGSKYPNMKAIWQPVQVHRAHKPNCQINHGATSLASSWRYPHLVELLWQQNILMLYISTAVLSSFSSRALASIQYHSDDICICLRRS